MVKGVGNLPCIKCGASTGRDSQVKSSDFLCDKCKAKEKGKTVLPCPLCFGKGFVIRP